MFPSPIRINDSSYYRQDSNYVPDSVYVAFADEAHEDLCCSTTGPRPSRAWFIGMNPELGDEAPALALADRPEEVPVAAREFIAN